MRAHWLAYGSVAVPVDVIPRELWDELTTEAKQFEPDALERDNSRQALVVHRNGSLMAPQRCRTHGGGTALRRLAHLPGLARIAAEATGHRRVTPIRWGYKFYVAGDFMQAHLDDGRCTITFSCALTRDMEPMGWLPRLRHLTPDEVAQRLVGQPYPEDGREFPLKYRELTGFDGIQIPHWRPPYQGDHAIMITMCFTDLP
jgi:hypothetical protein